MDISEITAQEIKDSLDASFYKAVHNKFMYIPESGQLINKETGDVAGKLDFYGYLKVYFASRSYFVHRLIYYIYHGHFPKGQIDHINRIKTDNRIANLRDVSTSKNPENPNLKANKSNVKGVTWNRHENRWQARAYYKRKPLYVGSFKHFINAVKARHYAEQKFGYLKKDVKSPAEKYLENAKQMKFNTNITFAEEKKIGRNSVSGEWEFFCLNRKKQIDELVKNN